MAYVRRKSLGVEFLHQAKGRLEKFTNEKIYGIMKQMAHYVVDAFKANRQFYNVTGNTFTSFYAIVYYKGKMKYVVQSAEGEKSPTRATLAKGEFYDLDYYYDGGAVKGKPYKGKEGKGGQWGPNLIYGRMGKFGKPTEDWGLMCVCPIEYAKFNEKILKTMYETYEEYPNLFSASILAINDSTFNLA